jgi:hypothetical protein
LTGRCVWDAGTGQSLSTDAIEYLLTMYANLPGSCDSDPHLATSYPEDGNCDIFADGETFTYSSEQDQHFRLPLYASLGSEQGEGLPGGDSLDAKNILVSCQCHN